MAVRRNGVAVRLAVQTATGWRDEVPLSELAPNEQATLSAVLAVAREDVRFDLASAAPSRRAEMLAWKITAWEWFTLEQDELESKLGCPVSERLTFGMVCEGLDLDPESTRREILRGVSAPDGDVAEEYREELLDDRREVKSYLKRCVRVVIEHPDHFACLDDPADVSIEKLLPRAEVDELRLRLTPPSPWTSIEQAVSERLQ